MTNIWRNWFAAKNGKINFYLFLIFTFMAEPISSLMLCDTFCSFSTRCKRNTEISQGLCRRRRRFWLSGM
jgi:hypothetical protein